MVAGRTLRVRVVPRGLVLFGVLLATVAAGGALNVQPDDPALAGVPPGGLPACVDAGPLQLHAEFFPAGTLQVEAVLRAELQTARVGVPMPGSAQMALIDPRFTLENLVDVLIDQEGEAVFQHLDPVSGTWLARGRLDDNCVEVAVEVPGTGSGTEEPIPTVDVFLAGRKG